jgi:hypothetical protein
MILEAPAILMKYQTDTFTEGVIAGSDRVFSILAKTPSYEILKTSFMQINM